MGEFKEELKRGLRHSLGIGKKKYLTCNFCKTAYEDKPYYWPIDGVCSNCYIKGIEWAIKKSMEEKKND